MKQYLLDESGESETGLVGEEARVRIARALTDLWREQNEAEAVEDGPSGAYGRITILAHSFGAVPVVEALETYRRPLGAPIRLITLGAPLGLAGAQRRELARAVAALRDGDRLASWHCVWSERDYLSSDPDAAESERFKPLPVGPSWTRWGWPSANHAKYFDNDDVAEVILAA